MAPVSAKILQKAPTASFAANCAKNAPNATCRCIIAKLAATIEGNFIMETAAIYNRYPGEPPKSVMMAVINRYDLTLTEYTKIADGAEATLRAAGKSC